MVVVLPSCVECHLLLLLLWRRVRLQHDLWFKGVLLRWWHLSAGVLHDNLLSFIVLLFLIICVIYIVANALAQSLIHSMNSMVIASIGQGLGCLGAAL